MIQTAEIAGNGVGLSPAESSLREALAKTMAAQPAASSLRAAGAEAFADTGFPQLTQEAWKYTSLRNLARRTFQPSGPVSMPEPAAVAEMAIEGLAGPKLVFVNGWYVPGLSDPQAADGLELHSLGEMLTDPAAELPQTLATLTDLKRHPFAALNQGMLEHGVVVRARAGSQLTEPVYLLFLSTPAAEPQACHPRLLIETGANASMTVLEHYASLGSNENLTNVVSELHLAVGSKITHHRIQDASSSGFHIGGLFASVGRDARLESHNMCFGGALTRIDLEVALAEPGAEVDLNGLYCLSGRQHADNHTIVAHQAPRTRSDQDYRGVMDGRSRAVFSGKAIVHQDAQKIEAHQSNSNLLLSKQAEIDTKPELEIYADDVKCSHGATVGQLDPSALFYLRSRGIDLETARALLTYAFAEAVLGRIELEPVRKRLETAVAGTLPERSLIEDLL
ncbi:MAG: Fe-S cluster assembly protein SufD [Gammaproteobacteria bacterium]